MDDFAEYVTAAWGRLLRSAWLLTGDWHLAEDPCALKGTLEACLRVRGAGPVWLYL